ncbi:MAG TPA: hypothetical protein DEQ87_05565 [Algoriphagus sp.]|jgi:hypothetical protein|uniref:DUF6090 family protein n=1 Tax=unclassified Algoriphagus TaxID=2641541 RepID=UPI000C6031AE|nr:MULTISPECIES: DUF6090 family protein [unclassified Algoriphagus]MAL12961.1 hypothetical protein [Algoriphagus sp.]MAN86305.1 hypothetical protein [Algoriphagus sp.]QYH39316.1 hypothetical protein GYM62_11170 [Algoriphagus sp. NBT04N3]HAS60954.1 hypothetical protein [Algoriphagus sp.]HCB45883.1 hypothetical protein [Algoriphagus sp.]|tara:strand:+ start:11623 stop:12381 length:759 start_codon:yes stop_codon:yes gene_type:complete
MLHLFKKIRKKLLKENRLKNYLVYALGEILLVVIGILIALAINNANQNRIIKNKEQNYLIGLKNEFSTSKAKLLELMKINQENLITAKAILIQIDKKEVSSSQLSSMLFQTYSRDISFNPNNSLLLEMISSGSLRELSNLNLRHNLTNWLATLDDIAKQEKDLLAQREKALDLFRSDEFSLRTILEQSGVSSQMGIPVTNQGSSILPILESLEFENSLLQFILSTEATQTLHYQPLLADLEIILEMLEKEIK